MVRVGRNGCWLDMAGCVFGGRRYHGCFMEERFCVAVGAAILLDPKTDRARGLAGGSDAASISFLLVYFWICY